MSLLQQQQKPSFEVTHKIKQKWSEKKGGKGCPWLGFIYTEYQGKGFRSSWGTKTGDWSLARGSFTEKHEEEGFRNFVVLAEASSVMRVVFHQGFHCIKPNLLTAIFHSAILELEAPIASGSLLQSMLIILEVVKTDTQS